MLKKFSKKNMIQRIYYEQCCSAVFQLSKSHFESSAITLYPSAAVKMSSYRGCVL